MSISYASRGISLADTDDMSPYDRKLILDTVIKIGEMRSKTLEEDDI